MSTTKKRTTKKKKAKTELKSSLEAMNKAPLAQPLEGDVMPPGEPGRPTLYGPAIVTKLIAAFNNGYNITEACQYAEISRQTYNRWLTEHDGFSDRMEEAKNMVNRVAKETVVNAIAEGDAGSARWWLERRDPDFKGKLEVDPGEHLRETKDKIKDFLNDRDDDNPAEPDAAGTEPPAADSGSEGEDVAEPTPPIS